MKHFLLFYDFVPDYLERRTQFRSEHLELAWASSGRGELLMGGALTDPVDTGVLLFQGDSAETAEAFARKDPYVTGGLVTHWKVREWMTVAGSSAAQPLRS